MKKTIDHINVCLSCPCFNKGGLVCRANYEKTEDLIDIFFCENVWFLSENKDQIPLTKKELDEVYKNLLPFNKFDFKRRKKLVAYFNKLLNQNIGKLKSGSCKMYAEHFLIRCNPA